MTLDISRQVKIVTLEIVKIYITLTEYRVAHLMMSNLCNKFPQDPYLWSYLGKLYLNIGKRENAVQAFEKAESTFSSLSNVPKEVAETNKFFNK